MAKIEYKNLNDDNSIKIGDYVFCAGINDELDSFWGIVIEEKIIGLDDGSYVDTSYKDIYLNKIISEWKITKRIPNNKVKIIIEETK